MFGPAFEAFKQRLLTDSDFRNAQADCPLCEQKVQDRKVALYQSLIDDLYKVYCWCGEHATHEFTMKDIRHLLGQINYTRFGDLVRFGGIVYKLGKAHYGINMARAKEFFAGQRKIPVQITLNQLTNEIIESNYVDIHHFPTLQSLLTKDGLYDPHKTIQNENQNQNPVRTDLPTGSPNSDPDKSGQAGALW